MIFKTLSILLIFSLLGFSQCSTDADVFTLEHSIGSSEFKEIASVNIRTVRQNQNQAQYQSYNSINNQKHESDQPKYHDVQFSTPIEALVDESARYEIKQALTESEGSLYRVRLCERNPEYQCSTASFITLKKVSDANYQINLTINTGINNRMSSISIKTREARNAVDLNSLENFTFHTSIQNIKQGQNPDSEAYLDKVKKEIEQKEKAATGGNESFLQKYWMYIVPFVVIMFLMNLVNPEASG